MPKAKNQSPEPLQPERGQADQAMPAPAEAHAPAPAQTPAQPRESSMPLVVLLVSTAGFLIFNGLASIVALVLGYDTRRKMRAGIISKNNVGLLKAGMILAYAGGAFGVILLGFIAMLGISEYNYSH